MSYPYRIKVKQAVEESVTAEDRVVTKVNLTKILPLPEMKQILQDCLEDHGWQAVHGEPGLYAKEGPGGELQVFDVEKMTVTASLEDAGTIQKQGELTVTADSDDPEAVKQSLKAKAERQLADQIAVTDEDRDRKKAELEARISKKLMASEAGRKQDLNEVLKDVYGEAVKKKSSTLGTVLSTEETGKGDDYELTIKIAENPRRRNGRRAPARGRRNPHAGDVVGWTYDGATFCTEHRPGREPGRDGPEPIIDVQDQGWERDVCDVCGQTLAYVEGVIVDSYRPTENPGRGRNNPGRGRSSSVPYGMRECEGCGSLIFGADDCEECFSRPPVSDQCLRCGELTDAPSGVCDDCSGTPRQSRFRRNGRGLDPSYECESCGAPSGLGRRLCHGCREAAANPPREFLERCIGCGVETTSFDRLCSMCRVIRVPGRTGYRRNQDLTPESRRLPMDGPPSDRHDARRRWMK